MKKNKQVQVIGTIISIFIIFMLIFLTNVDISKYSYIEAVQNKIAYPFRKLSMQVKKLSRNEDKRKEFFDLKKLQEENKNLKNENDTLKEKQRQYDMLIAENQTLNKKLNLKNRYNEYTSIPAGIILRNSDNFSEYAIIDIGKNENIEEGMAVVAEGGLYR